MMSPRQIYDHTGTFLLLLIFLLCLSFISGIVAEPCSENFFSREQVFVGVWGDITHPGVYAFSESPGLCELINRSGGLSSHVRKSIPMTKNSYGSGEAVHVRLSGGIIQFCRRNMPSHYRITLGIPISVNQETQEGLTAVHGIGPKVASAIIQERKRRGGYRRLDDLLSVPGFGYKLYTKVSPFLVL